MKFLSFFIHDATSHFTIFWKFFWLFLWGQFALSSVSFYWNITLYLGLFYRSTLLCHLFLFIWNTLFCHLALSMETLYFAICPFQLEHCFVICPFLRDTRTLNFAICPFILEHFVLSLSKGR